MRSRRLLCKWLMTKLVQPGCNQKAAQLKKKDPHLPSPYCDRRVLKLCVEEQLTKIKREEVEKVVGLPPPYFPDSSGQCPPFKRGGHCPPHPCFVVQFYLIQGRLNCSNWATSSSLNLQPKAPAFCRTCSAVSHLHWNNAPERSTS